MGQITDESYAHRRVMSAGPKWNMIFDDDHFSGAQQYPITVAMTGPMNLAELKMLVEDLQGFIDTLEGPVERADTICSLPTSLCEEMKHPGDGDKVVPHYVSEHGGDGALKPSPANQTLKAPALKPGYEEKHESEFAFRPWPILGGPNQVLGADGQPVKSGGVFGGTESVGAASPVGDAEGDGSDAVDGDESAAAGGSKTGHPAYKSGRHKSHK